MKIKRETDKPTERCDIDLEQNFASRTEALNYIWRESGPSVHNAVRDELYNANEPTVWIRFRIAGEPAILSFQLSQ